jgi:hypothetical protein
MEKGRTESYGRMCSTRWRLRGQISFEIGCRKTLSYVIELPTYIHTQMDVCMRTYITYIYTDIMAINKNFTTIPIKVRDIKVYKKMGSKFNKSCVKFLYKT